MSTAIAKNTWVEIHCVILQAGERAPQVPEDTQQVPLEMRARGVLLAPANIGDTAEIETVTGRRLSGTLLAANPAYTHQFGEPVPELLPIGSETREQLRERGIFK